MHPHRHAFSSSAQPQRGSQRDPPPADERSSGQIRPSRATIPRRKRIEPHGNDVLLGRGGKNNQHAGNEKLRIIARVQCDEYRIASKKGKSSISRDLVRQIRQMDPPGRFLRRSAETGDWEDVGDEIAREKAGQVLRDAVSYQIGPVAASSPALVGVSEKKRQSASGGHSRPIMHAEASPPVQPQHQGSMYYSLPTAHPQTGSPYRYDMPRGNEIPRPYHPPISPQYYQHTPPSAYRPHPPEPSDTHRKRPRLYELPPQPRLHEHPPQRRLHGPPSHPLQFQQSHPQQQQSYFTPLNHAPPGVTPPRNTHSSMSHNRAMWTSSSGFSPASSTGTRSTNQSYPPSLYSTPSTGQRQVITNPTPNASLHGVGSHEYDLLREELLSDHSDHEGSSSPLPRSSSHSFG